MKKIGVLLLVFLLVLVVVSAQNETTEDKAISCLKNKLGDDCAGSASVEQIALSLLAMSSESSVQSDCKSALLDKQKKDNSWGNIKETSLAIISLENIGKNTDDEIAWLLSKKRTPVGLEWYLEIDLTGEDKSGECTLTYDTTSKKITVSENKKLSGSPGSCLSLAYDNYWLKISENCLNKNFTVSCDKDFISTILYKKTNSAVWHVSADVQSASAAGTTEHEVNAYCFGLTSCNYEENLWAALALDNTGNDLSGVIPYLIALSEDNKKLFPETFLYIFTTSENYLQEIIGSQDPSSYWDLKEKGKFYDTALGLLAISGSQSADLAKEWLGEVQDKKRENEGCWNNGNVRDTSFLLWAAYPKTPSATDGEALPNCASAYYCTTNAECIEASGNKLEGYWCASPKICCNKPALEGLECEKSGYDCKLECSENEEPATYKCNTGETCCKPELRERTCIEKGGETCEENQECDKTTVSASDTTDCCLGTCEKKGGYSWIVLLIILIILVILGIIFRNKLRILIFKFRSKFRKGPVTKTRPGFPPAAGAPAGLRRMFPTRILPRMPIRTIKRAATKTDKELEETLKKLREISK